MKMCANEDESVDIRNYASWRSNLIDLEERNRMERPSRVFSSLHHTMPPVLTDSNNMEPNEQSRRSREYSSYFETHNNSTRFGSSTSNGDNVRNRSPFVRFTITDPETRQITAAGQIPLNSTPPGTHTSTLTNTSAEMADVPINEDSDDEPVILERRHYFDNRRFVDHYNSMSHNPQQSRSIRSGRRTFSEHPYFLRNNLDNYPVHYPSRINNRRVRFSSLNQIYSDSYERPQTPEQELPEVLEHDMEPDNTYEEYHDQESISTVSTRNDVDSGDDDRSVNFSISGTPILNVDEENMDTIDVTNETPRTRVVPFIMSPTPVSPRTDSPSNTPALTQNDTVSTPFAFIDHDDENHNVMLRDPEHRVTEDTATVLAGDQPETYVDLNDQLIRLFECPVCFEHIIPPVFQCLLGHLICSKCVLLCENCPTCRNAFNSKRNLYMEKVGYLVKFPCKNALTGCKQQMFLSQKKVHELECCYRHYQCFFTNCSWKGYYPDLHVHMSDNHSSHIMNGTDQSLDIIMSQNCYKWFLLANDEYFAVIALVTRTKCVKIQVNYIGPAVKAKQFKFSIVLSQRNDYNDSLQKLTYERTTLPYSENYDLTNNFGLKKDIFCFSGEVIEPYFKFRRRRLPIVLKVNPVSV